MPVLTERGGQEYTLCLVVRIIRFMHFTQTLTGVTKDMDACCFVATVFSFSAGLNNSVCMHVCICVSVYATEWVGQGRKNMENHNKKVCNREGLKVARWSEQGREERKEVNLHHTICVILKMTV